MGDEILMKKTIVLAFLAIYLHAEDERIAMVSDYQKMFRKIGEKRIGIDNRKIDALATPFVKSEKAKKKTKVVEGKVVVVAPKPDFVLQAIINKKVKINGSWYALGDTVGDLKVASIKNSTVWLKNRDFKKRLTMRKENAKISIK